MEETEAAAIEVEVPALLDARRDGEIGRVAEAASRMLALDFVVFPGNVGDDQALVSVAAMLSSRDGGGRTGQSVAHLRVD